MNRSNPATSPLIIVNPASAGGSTGRKWPALAVRINNRLGAFESVFTSGRGDGERLALEAARKGRNFIVACGGDGTISEVANGIISSECEVEMGILPCGTGGDFRKTLDIPAAIEEAAQVLASGVTRRIDIGHITYINHKGANESRYFINVASFGMSGDVVDRVNQSSKILGGSLTFAVATFETTLSYNGPEIMLKIDDKDPLRRRIQSVSIANGRYFGGGMMIAPEAKINDGLFDVICIKALGMFEILSSAHRLYKGTHLTMPQVVSTRAAAVEAAPANPNEIVKIEADGEGPGRLPAVFRIVPSALSVRCPNQK